MISPEVREDAQRFQDMLSKALIKVFTDGPQYDVHHWPFSVEDHAVTSAMSFAVALRLMLAVMDSYLPVERAERERQAILAWTSQPIDLGEAS